VPDEVGHPPFVALAGEEAAPVQHRVRLAQRHHLLEEPQYVGVAVDLPPVEPAEFVVLAVGVVVAVLGPPDLVAHADHGDALRQQEDGGEVLDLPAAEVLEPGVVARSFPS
jgi:hypothetical protein